MSRLLLLARLTPWSARNLHKTASKLAGSLGNNETEQVWQDPWKHALPKKDQTLTTYEEAPVNWECVQRLIPDDLIPEPPTEQKETPSGWRPPKDPAPDLPYYIKRNRFHLPALYLKRRRDDVNTQTLEYNYKEVVQLKGVFGDVFACERDLKAFLERRLGHPIATYVEELQGRIDVCGADRSSLEAFVFESGF